VSVFGARFLMLYSVPVNRRQFLASLGAGTAVMTARAAGVCPSTTIAGAPAITARNWAWMRGSTTPIDAWRRKLAAMRAAGIDAVLISGNAAFYRTAVPAAAQEGIEVHAWLFTMMRGENVQAHPDWYAVSRSGVSTAVKPPYVDYYKFMCPSRDEVRQHLLGVVRELAQVGGLGSIHLDYIRYPDVILPVALWPKYNLVQDKEYPEFDFCYCDVCRARFKRQSGVDPKELADPPGDRAWRQYRCDTITEVVGLLSDEVHAHGVALTAAVFPTPTIARTLVRQDWTRWKLDAVLPMTYNGFYKEDVAWIERATREGVSALGGRIPLFSGLYVPDLPPADLAKAAAHALAGGARGISVFEANGLTPEHWAALSAALKKGRDPR
jgi:uncharacterized lipoprotein YddW (UPF0748 family)